MADTGASVQAKPNGAALLSRDIVHLGPAQWGMLSFLTSEVAFFSTLIVVYLTYSKTPDVGPTPAILSLRLVIGTTICLLASSATIHKADKAHRQGNHAVFKLWWSLTIILGILFLAGTGYEWNDLIRNHGLTISRNLFGSAFYTLIGFHALHVTVGVITMLIILAVALKTEHAPRPGTDVELVSWYWHFVDGVWIVVFTVVYLLPHFG
jgi:cytochrome c oxidase subunit 3/cytochrome o ubiquinol oxidase subunit 3